MANISRLKVGTTIYDIKDSAAAITYNLSAYQTSSSILPLDYYKATFHASGEPVEMKYVKTNGVSTADCSPLKTNTQYIVFALNRLEGNGYYWGYIVYNYSDRKFVGLFNSNSGSAKRPTVLNRVFFDETNYSKIQDTVDDYYNEKGMIRSMEFTDDIGVELDCTITDAYQNETIATVPCATITRAGVMTKTDKQLLNKTVGVQSPVDITNNVKTWLSDNNNGKNTTSTINAGSVINDINASVDSSSSIKINQYKVLYFTIASNTTLCNGTNTTAWTLYPGTYVCKQLDGYIPNQLSNEVYYTFTFVSNTYKQGDIAVPKIATGFIHIKYVNTDTYVGWAIERVGRCVLSYLAS